MAKFFALYKTPVAIMEDWQKNTSPEEMKSQMEKMMHDMNAWTEKYKDHLVGEGSPLGITKTVTKDGVADSKNDCNYFNMVEADSHEEAAKIFMDSPHMQIPNSSVDVMAIPHMGL